jgi:hypothetical protein
VSRCSVKMMILRWRPSASRMCGSFWRSLDSSSHLRSLPDSTTALACCSNALRMRISASSSCDGLRGGGLVDELLFESFLLLGVEVVVVLGDPSCKRLGEQVAAATPSFALGLATASRAQALAAALERLEDGLGARREAALKGGEREADGALARPSSWSALPISSFT